jgi:two-component system sensor histidine kinase HydH
MGMAGIMGPGMRMMGRHQPLGFMGEVDASPAFAYLQMDSARFGYERLAVTGGAILISLLFLGFYIVLQVMYTRNRMLRLREERTKELVSLGEAARTLAHEIKNPLGIIRIQCGYLRRSLGEEASKGLQVIDEETVRLGFLVDRIRDYLKSGEGNPSEVDMENFLEEVMRHWMDRIRCVSKTSGIVRIDRERLRGVLDNLIRNALDAQTSVGAKNLVCLESYVRKKNYIIEIQDHGSGIKAEDVPRLFEPFFTTKENGSGLGLALSKKHSEAAGGSLHYAQRQGGGSIFSLSLPLSRNS